MGLKNARAVFKKPPVVKLPARIFQLPFTICLVLNDNAPMKPLERYLATLAGKPIDHLARTPILMQFAAEHIGSNYGAFASDFKVLTASNFACAREFGSDQVSTISDPYRETQGRRCR